MVELRRNALNQLELELARLRICQETSRHRARSLEADLAARQRELVDSTRLGGAELRAHDEYAGFVHQQNRAALDAAKRLEAEERRLLTRLAEAQLSLDAVEKLRFSRRKARRLELDRRLAAELDELSMNRWVAGRREMS